MAGMSKRLLEVLCSPWAIEPSWLPTLQSIYERHVKGEKADIAAIEAEVGRPLANTQPAVNVDANGIATLEVNGVMAPRANLVMQISGGISTQMLAAQLDSLRADTRVKGAVIVWDSPGGNTFGVPAAAAALAELAAVKPTASLARGMMASAAYWAGSAASVVLLEGSTDVVGSIGVYTRLQWDSPQSNTLEIVRGKYKRVAVNGQAPSAEVVAAVEAQVDYLYTEFIDAVATHRGVSSDAVLTDMADGRLFTGRLAIDAGLADGMSTLPALQASMAADPSRYMRRRPVAVAVRSPSTTGAQSMEPDKNATQAGQAAQPPITRESIERDHAELFAALRAEFTTAGAAAERERIAAVRAPLLPGPEDLIEALAADGKTSGPEAAAAVVHAERELAGQRAAAILADKPKPLVAVASATGENPDDKPAVQKAGTIDDAKELAAAIVKRQAEAAAAGQTLSATQALALIRKESSNG